MEYTLTTTGERVRLDVLANADKSMVGLQIGKSKIISMLYVDFLTLVVSVLGEREINNFEFTLFKYHVFPVQKKDGENDESIIVMETLGDCISTDSVLDILKFYQSSDIFSCYLFSYRIIDGKLRGGGLGKVLLREHAIHWPLKPYKMTSGDQNEFYTWFESHREICAFNQNEKFRKMKSLYLDSYLIDNADLSFAMLSVVLEMMVNSTSELQYRISRSVGIFLSSNKNEMREIFKCVKRLYGIRSKYVHEGKSVPWEDLFELREIVRKILVLMYEQEMHKTGFDFKTFSDELTYVGYLDG